MCAAPVWCAMLDVLPNGNANLTKEFLMHARPADIHTLAELKRFFALPGASVFLDEIGSYDSDGNYVAREVPERLAEARTVALLQSNAVKFAGNSWLYFGKARDWSFNNDYEFIHATCDDGQTRLVYLLFIDKEAISA